MGSRLIVHNPIPLLVAPSPLRLLSPLKGEELLNPSYGTACFCKNAFTARTNPGGLSSVTW